MTESIKLSIDEIKSCEIHILETFADFCEKNNLSYYLDYGTLIGAVRHKGFIPWDDDIDVSMPRPDYNSMCELLKARNNSLTDTIQLKTPYSKDYQYQICKLVDTSTFVHEITMKEKYNTSIWIDIFPIDALPSEENDARKFVHKIGSMCKYYFYTIEKRFSGKSVFGWIKFNILKSILTIPFEVFHKQQKIDIVAQKYPFESASHYCVITYPGAVYVPISKDDLDKASVLFEGREYTTYKNYDEYLRSFYGDYMQLPPQEERVYKHGFDAYRV